MSYVISNFHLVVNTDKKREVLDLDKHKDLFSYVVGICRDHDCFVYAIGGFRNHFHIAFSLHPSVCLADIVKAIKVGSNLWIKRTGTFPLFDRWARRYYAASFSQKDLKAVKKYIHNQYTHHGNVSLDEELIKFLNDNNIPFDPEYL